MTKTILALTGILIALAALAIFSLAANVSADTRDLRDRGATGRTIESTPTPPPPAPSPAPTPPPPSGGITSTTVGSVSSGGNQGGNVTTGDEYVEVYEVNIGPTNPPPPPPPSISPNPTPPVAEPECDGRSRECTTSDSGRTR